MGWTSFQINCNETTDSVLRREFSEAGADGSCWEITDSATVGATWYAISKRTDPTGTAHYYGLICFTKRKYIKDDRPRGNSPMTEFFYKDMSEDCGPYAYDCPARILNKLDQLAPNPAGYALNWRQSCREHAANKRAKAKARAQQKAETLAKMEKFISERFTARQIGV
jgi:hypothetical protein